MTQPPNDPQRMVTPKAREEDQIAEKSLRPKRLEEYIGQEKVVANLKIAIAAAKQRGEPLDHTLFYGPPGLGKTTISAILANEMGVNIKITSGPAIERAGDLAAILTNLKKMMCCLSMRSTDSIARSRKCSTRRWKISPWISSLAKGRAPATCV